MEQIIPIQPELLRGTKTGDTVPYEFFPAADGSESNQVAIELKIDPKAGCRSWLPTDFLIIDGEAQLNSSLAVEAAFYRNGAEVFRMHNRVVGGRRVRCCFELKYLDSSRAFPRNLPGHLKCSVSGKPVRAEEIDEVRLRIFNGLGLRRFLFYGVFIAAELPALTVDGAPLVDRFGQWCDKEWSGKIHSEEALAAFLHEEYDWAQRNNRYPGDDYDRFGGWKRLHFEAKGRFYRRHDGRRWWLVDPDGNAFFSNGICYGSRTGIYGMTEAFGNLFEELPPVNDPVFGAAWTTADMIPEYVKRNGLEAARGKRLYNFARANMLRVFGNGWRDAWIAINSARMKAWGFNTISVCVNDYTDENPVDFLQKAGLPYCWTLKNFPKMEKLIYRDFPDVFSDEYTRLCREFAQQLRPVADDVFFIGYFITNEPEWMFQHDVNLAERAFAFPELTETKRALIGLLRQKYGSIDALNQAWRTRFEGFEALETPVENADQFSENAAADFMLLRGAMMDRYSEIPAACLREVAPRALNLGMRYGGVGGDDFSGKDRFDVFSFNCYSRRPAEKFKPAENKLGMPYVIGEWHIGGSDSGLMSNALVNATTQAERGKACAEYMREALTTRGCVGVHYFEWNDQPLLGRFDGENMQIGLIDVCNRPYTDCIREFSAMNRRMYEILNGDVVPEELCWQFQSHF